MIQMASQNYYSEERKLYSEAYSFKISNKDGKMVIRKLSKHYNLTVPSLRFWGNRDSGSCGTYRIRLSNNPSLGLIIHEFAHYVKGKGVLKLNLANSGTSHHGLLFQTTLNKIHQYAKSKGYWKTIIEKRKTKKAEVIKTEMEKVIDPTYEQSLKIDQKEKKILEWTKKLNRLNKLYQGKISRAKRSISMLRRGLNKISEKNEERKDLISENNMVYLEQNKENK